ncbi:MAG: HD domain-containing phosphohydrolase [Candidatus Eremiobacterota bacterium]
MADAMTETNTSLTPASSVSDFVANNPLFYSLHPDVIASIADRCQVRRFHPNDVIVREGDIGDSFYLIRSGHVRVVKNINDEELVLSELGLGEGFGEMALLFDQPRSATVKAIDDVEALVLIHEDFTALTRRIPELAEKMNKLRDSRVSLLEGEGSSEENRRKFKAGRRLELDYSYLDMLMQLNDAAGGPEQVEHCKETGQLAREMSKMLCPMVSEEILFAGYLHEIGKVSLARSLVVKERKAREPLTEEEQERFDRVFQYAVEILEPNQNLHENLSFIRYLNNTDYRKMPLEAQILKVADDYLMLRSRNYADRDDEEALGVIKSRSGTMYNPRVVAALEKNIDLYKLLRVEAQLNVMRMMVIALDRKDNYTFRHSMDVRDMGMKIVHKLNLGRKEQEYYRIGAELHDVGKIYIDEEILNAPRKLTADEFEIMKTHAARSADFFRNVPGMDELVTIVRGHHEKFDGTGYPDGKKGQDIPFLTRIMTIADVWSALTTKRIYRTKQFTLAEALKIMEEMQPGHFDPDLFPIFQGIVGEMIAAEEAKKQAQT